MHASESPLRDYASDFLLACQSACLPPSFKQHGTARLPYNSSVICSALNKPKKQPLGRNTQGRGAGWGVKAGFFGGGSRVFSIIVGHMGRQTLYHI